MWWLKYYRNGKVWKKERFSEMEPLERAQTKYLESYTPKQRKELKIKTSFSKLKLAPAKNTIKLMKRTQIKLD